VSFTGPTNYTAGHPYSVAVGDFNSDGHPDLAVANEGFGGGSVSILLGTGDGTFTGPTNFPTGRLLVSVAVGDFNGDGHPDLAVVDVGEIGGGSVSIFLGTGDGTFTGAGGYGVGESPRSVAVGDFNGDGHPDLAVANAGSDNVSILLGTGGGAFTGPTNFPVGTAPSSVAVGDFNSDGHPDLSVANYGSNNVSVLRNNSVPSNPCCQLPCHPQWWCWGWLPLSPSLELNWGPLHR
jgi:hypothetical protein